MTAYIDSNIFILAFTNTDQLGNKARDILNLVVKGKLTAITSFLTFDEFFWALRKHVSKEHALDYTKTFLNTPALRFIDVNEKVIWQAYLLLEKYPLDPRDALHAATSIIGEATQFLTQDKDFVRVQELKVQML